MMLSKLSICLQTWQMKLLIVTRLTLSNCIVFLRLEDLKYDFGLPKIYLSYQVLGLVGTNGIGKSTALKILSGKLKPNLGKFDVSFSVTFTGFIEPSGMESHS